MSDIDQVDLTTLLGTLRFYSRFRGEIPPSICAKAADRIEELEAALPRTPTEPMLIAARNWSQLKYGKPIGNDAASGCWQAMLDAVLQAKAEK